MDVIIIERKFKVGTIMIDDPNPNFTLAEVQKFLSIQYPEITNSSTHGPIIQNIEGKDVQVFSYEASAGVKG